MTRYLEPAAIITLAIAVTIIGEPPLSLFVGAFGGITGAFALYHTITGDDT